MSTVKQNTATQVHGYPGSAYLQVSYTVLKDNATSENALFLRVTAVQ